MGATSSRSFPNKRLDGHTAIVTGSSAGIGKFTAKELYKLGARVILACRDMPKANNAIIEIKAETNEEKNLGELVVEELNLSSLTSIRRCAENINNSEKEIHYLVNNAGVMMCPKSKTEDGFETHFGVNHLGHFLFTCLLLDKLIKSSPSKIINVSSSGHEKGDLNFEDLNFDKRPYSAFAAYCQSKLANVLFTKELARRLSGTGVTAFSLHPGIVRTELGRHLDKTYFVGARSVAALLFSPFSISPQEGSRTTLFCILDDNDSQTGSYYSDCKVKEPSQKALNTEDAIRLWDESCKMVNLDFDPLKSK